MSPLGWEGFRIVHDIRVGSGTVQGFGLDWVVSGVDWWVSPLSWEGLG